MPECAAICRMAAVNCSSETGRKSLELQCFAAICRTIP